MRVGRRRGEWRLEPKRARCTKPPWGVEELSSRVTPSTRDLMSDVRNAPCLMKPSGAGALVSHARLRLPARRHARILDSGCSQLEHLFCNVEKLWYFYQYYFGNRVHRLANSLSWSTICLSFFLLVVLINTLLHHIQIFLCCLLSIDFSEYLTTYCCYL
jgi:hypothetical protein